MFAKTEHPDNSDVGSHGVCYKDGSNKILFNGGVNLRLIIHELWHAHMNYFYLNSTNEVGRDDFEEMQAEWLELNLAVFQSQARHVAKVLMGEKQASKEWRQLCTRRTIK